MVDLDVWDIVQIPVEHRLLGTIWVFCKKVNSDGVISKFKAQLCAQGSFQIPRQDFKETYAPTGRFADLGELNLLLGVKVLCVNDKALFLSQKVYTNKILADHNILNAQPVSTPMVPNTQLMKATQQEQSEFEQVGTNYCRTVGMLMYLALCTRPDILFTLSQLSQHLESPGIHHWHVAIHLLRYLCGTKHYGVILNGNQNSGSVNVYSDADWANDPYSR